MCGRIVGVIALLLAATPSALWAQSFSFGFASGGGHHHHGHGCGGGWYGFNFYQPPIYRYPPPLVYAPPPAVVAVPTFLRFRQKRYVQETIRLMVEKGQPIPPELFIEKPAPRSDLRRGIVLCALGVGLIVFLLCVSRHVWGIGAIPLFLGLGHLVAWRLERGKTTDLPA